MNIYILSNGQIFDVTKCINGLTWRYELDTLAGDLSFSIANEQFGVGNIVIVKKKNNEVFRGIIVTENGRRVKSLSAYDMGWYLNKNEILIQFKKASVYDAILSVTKKYNIAVELPSTLKKITITKLYKDELVGDIIRDLLDHATKTTNNRYHMRVIGKVLAIRTFQRDPIVITEIGRDYDMGKTIENMSNQVVITSSEEKNKKVYAVAKDDASIKQFGLLQTMESVDAKDKSKARNIAKNTLKELNKIEENISFSCKGDVRILSGSRVLIENGELKGLYVVKEVTHNYKNDDNYRCDLVVERWANFVGE